MKLLLAGATGLTGSRLLQLLLDRGHEVVSAGRRATGVSSPNLEEIYTDFQALASLPPADAAICTLGTTIARAGSQKAFRAVDHAAVLTFATAARAAGCRQFILMTAVGANPTAAAFYSRVKGEIERDVAALGFERLDLIRPGLILGPRAERRPLESLFQALAPFLNPLLQGRLARYAAIEADRIAGAIAALAGAPGSGVFAHENPELNRLTP
jgi:uncharacterized protein YbjT (DUF2867 family)